MKPVQLTAYQRQQLSRLLHKSPNVHVYRRALILLELDRGKSISEVARELSLSRGTVYNCLGHFSAKPDHRNCHLKEALADRPGRGRKSRWTRPIVNLLERSLEDSPWNMGYQAIVWTIPLLAVHLERKTGIRFSASSIRMKLHELDYVWKRRAINSLPTPKAGKKTASP